MKNKKVGIIGCGAILNRHIEAISSLEGFELKSLCDTNYDVIENARLKYNVQTYIDYKKMVEKEELDLVVVATPNSMHVDQAIYCLNNDCDVLVEKPVSLKAQCVKKISNIAKHNGKKAYCVLQVRLNPAVKLIKDAIDRNLLGNIRGFSLVQRWQRPVEYFTGWRGIPNVGGGTLHECGIHYLDILVQILGSPEVLCSKTYNTKHKNIDIEDTIYSLVDYGPFGGTIESTISAEPHNLECSLSIVGSNGFVKLGGKAMNIVETYNFLSNGSRVEFEFILNKCEIPNKPNSYGSYLGSCPNHVDLYKNLDQFEISQAYDSLKLIEDIYLSCNREYAK